MLSNQAQDFVQPGIYPVPMARVELAGWIELHAPTVDLLDIHPSVQRVGAQLPMAVLVAAAFVCNARSQRLGQPRVDQRQSQRLHLRYPCRAAAAIVC